MKKILYIITQSEWGGAQRYVFDLAINLQKSQSSTFSEEKGAGYAIHVAAGGDGPLFTRLEAQKLATTRLKHLVRAINPYHDLMAYFELKKLLDNIKPDIVHLNSSKAGFIGALAAKKAQVPKIIYTAHGFVFNEPLPAWKKWLYKKIELFNSRLTDKIICVSEYDRQIGIAVGIDPDKLITIHNGINQNKLNFLPRDEAQKQLLGFLNHSNSPILQFSTPVIGCIANFYPTKGLDVLIQAMAKIDATLILVGDGPENKNLRLLTSNLGLRDKIFFAGSIDNASQYLKAFDLFVLPSRKEGLPYTILEATAAGVPIVATAVGGVPEIIKDNQNGYLANPDDVDDLTDKINRALERPLPPTLSTDFTLATMITKTLTAYSA